LLGSALLAHGRAHAAGASTASLLYVSAEEGGEVVIIDAGAGEVVGRVPVGKRPRGLKLSGDGKHLFVALSGSPRGGPGVDESKLPPADRAADGIGMVEVASRKVMRTFDSGQDPESFDVSRDGRTLYVSNEESAEMSVLDLTAAKVIAKVPVGGEPEGVTLRPDGKFVYVTSEVSNQVFVVGLPSRKVVAQIATGARPRAVAFSRDGAKAFVTCELGGEVTVIDTKKLTPVAHIKIEAHAKAPLPPRPMGIVLAPDGKHLYVSNGRGASVAEIDVKTEQVSRFLDGVGDRPWGIAVSRDGRSLYTANGPSQDVSIIDIAAWNVTKKVAIGGLPWGIAVATGKL